MMRYIKLLVLICLFGLPAHASLLSDDSAGGDYGYTSTGFDVGADNTWTMCATHRWVTASPPNWVGHLISMENTTAGGNNDPILAARTDSNIERYIGANPGVGSQEVLGTTYTPDTNWHTTCIVNNGGTHTLYRDGTQVGTGGTGISYSGGTWASVVVGARIDAISSYAYSYISNVYILDSAKDSTWMGNHYSCRLNSGTTGMWAQWNLDTNCTSTVCQDETSNDRDLNLLTNIYESGTTADSFLTGTTGSDCIGYSAGPVISRTPTTLTPSVTVGGDATSQSFAIQNTGSGTLSYTVSDNQTWLSQTPTTGTSTGESDTITVDYSTSGLGVGTYNATITLTDSGATNSPQTIAVTLTVNASGTPPADTPPVGFTLFCKEAYGATESPTSASWDPSDSPDGTECSTYGTGRSVAMDGDTWNRVTTVVATNMPTSAPYVSRVLQVNNDPGGYGRGIMVIGYNQSDSENVTLPFGSGDGSAHFRFYRRWLNGAGVCNSGGFEPTSCKVAEMGINDDDGCTTGSCGNQFQPVSGEDGGVGNIWVNGWSSLCDGAELPVTRVTGESNQDVVVNDCDHFCRFEMAMRVVNVTGNVTLKAEWWIDQLQADGSVGKHEHKRGSCTMNSHTITRWGSNPPSVNMFTEGPSAIMGQSQVAYAMSAWTTDTTDGIRIGPASAMEGGSLDPDTEQRCKDIDALGGVNACVCSEPLITSWTPTDGWWDPPGSVTKPCGGDGGNGGAFYITGGSSSMSAPQSWYTVPSGSGIPNVFVTATSNGHFDGYYSSSRAMPTNVGRVCHRAMFRLSPDFVGRTTPLGGTCAGVKTVEINPIPGTLGNQFQGGFSGTDLSGNGDSTIYFTGEASTTGSDFFSNSGLNPTLADCKNGWCGFEQCWYGNFSTGALTPAYRTYVVDLNGSVVKQTTHTFLGTMTSNFPAPVFVGGDWILNLYRELASGPCPGTRAILYGMEAAFSTADDGTADHGPWIGPPTEMTGGGSPPPSVKRRAPFLIQTTSFNDPLTAPIGDLLKYDVTDYLKETLYAKPEYAETIKED